MASGSSNGNGSALASDQLMGVLPIWAKLLIVGIQKLGLATIILLVGGWWISTRVVAPLVDTYTEAIRMDMAARQRQEETLKQQAENLRTIGECQRTQTEILKNYGQQIGEILTATKGHGG